VGEIFGDTMVAAALIDRLVHHATMVTLKGKSYRPRERGTGIGSRRPGYAATRLRLNGGTGYGVTHFGARCSRSFRCPLTDHWATAAGTHHYPQKPTKQEPLRLAALRAAPHRAKRKGGLPAAVTEDRSG